MLGEDNACPCRCVMHRHHGPFCDSSGLLGGRLINPDMCCHAKSECIRVDFLVDSGKFLFVFCSSFQRPSGMQFRAIPHALIRPNPHCPCPRAGFAFECCRNRNWAFRNWAADDWRCASGLGSEAPSCAVSPIKHGVELIRISNSTFRLVSAPRPLL